MRQGRIGIRGRVVKNNCRGIGDEIEVHSQVLFITTVAARKRGVESGQDQSDLAGVKCTKKVGVFAIAGLGEAHGFYLPCIT